jgi:hypothetical protein
MSFEHAFEVEAGWPQFQLVVLDGRDDRLEDTALLPGLDGLPVASYDRFVGPRVAERIRVHARRDQTRIVLVSAYVRTNALLARRCQEAGVDYLYTLHELDHPDRFLATVLEPDEEHAAAALAPPRTWLGHDFDGTPKITEAIHLVEASPAAEQVLFDLPGKRFRSTAHHLRKLREDVGPRLALRPPSGGGDRTRHVPKNQLSTVLRRALGIPNDTPGHDDLPTPRM